MYRPPSRTSANRASISERTAANWLLTSTSGIGWGTASHSSDVDEIRRHDHNACNDHVLDVAQRVVGVRVGRPERPAGPGEAGAERGAADEREEQELDEGHAHDARRDRDEGSHERR